MKKGILSLAMFLAVSTCIHSQDFHAGLRMGMCMSQVSGDNLSGWNKAGLIGGAFVNRKFSKLITVQMEMVFIQKGSRKPVSDLDNSYYRMRLHYLEVPLLVQFHVSKKIRLEIGPSAGTLIFSQEDDQLGVISYTPPFNKLEISSHTGIGFIVSDHLAIDVRHSASLTTVRKFQGSYNYNFFDRGQYNSSLQLTLEYSF